MFTLTARLHGKLLNGGKTRGLLLATINIQLSLSVIMGEIL